MKLKYPFKTVETGRKHGFPQIAGGSNRPAVCAKPRGTADRGR